MTAYDPNVHLIHGARVTVYGTEYLLKLQQGDIAAPVLKARSIPYHWTLSTRGYGCVASYPARDEAWDRDAVNMMGDRGASRYVTTLPEVGAAVLPHAILTAARALTDLGQPVTSAALLRALGLPVTRASQVAMIRRLHALVDAGAMVRTGTRNSTRWALAGDGR